MTAAMTGDTPVYIIKSDPVPERYARGWHCLGLASDYGTQPVQLNYFGKKLVAYRGADDNEPDRVAVKRQDQMVEQQRAAPANEDADEKRQHRRHHQHQARQPRVNPIVEFNRVTHRR